jgi:VWFA-related protein
MMKMTVSLQQILCVWLALWFCASTALAQSGRKVSGSPVRPADTEQNVLRIPTTEVQLAVTVRDSLGLTVADLQAADFLIYDDGKRYETAHCEYRHIPTNVVLLLDLSNGWLDEPEPLYQAVQAFQRTLAPTDRLAVLQFTDELILTQDWASAETALRKALRPALRPHGKAALADAVAVAAAKLAETAGQRVILLLTSGFNTAGLLDFTQAQLAVQNVAATVYVFSETEAFAAASRQTPERDRPSSQAQEILRARLALAEMELTMLAEGSGGKIYFPVQERSLHKMLLETADELRGHYWLTYVIDEEELGLEHPHQIQVLTRAGHQAYTRTSSTWPTTQKSGSRYSHQ